jgi:hypothetical protein
VRPVTEVPLTEVRKLKYLCIYNKIVNVYPRFGSGAIRQSEFKDQ